jgi:prepilin-type N-terminal cleavage/methylation domain-containing protein
MNVSQPRLQAWQASFRRRGGRGRGARQEAVAFTLIEMLTVIAVIGLLAALVAGLSGAVGPKSRQNRIRAELNQLVTAIENYAVDFGHYPPDHVLQLNPSNPNAPLVDSVTNQLFYELSGVIVDNVNRQFHTEGQTETITTGTVKNFFNTDGFVNARTDPKKRPRAYFQPRPSQYAEISRPPNPDVEVLVVPVKWPLNHPSGVLFSSPIQPPSSVPPAEQNRLRQVNPWHYVSTRPTNNVTSFDLWAEWVEGKQVKILSNWNPDPQDKK